MPEAEVGTSTITDHAFRVGSGQPWWERCWFPGCHLGAAAHVTSEIALETPGLAYRCPDCVKLDREECSHEH